MTTPKFKVLVSDKLAEQGLAILKADPHIELTYKTGMTPDELKGFIPGFDALVVRSATTVTRDIIQAAKNLKVIGRAGIGVDNIDVDAATIAGIVVMNTPDGNSITTAEHTIAMLMAMVRFIPQATMTMKAGKWEKKAYEGHEVFNKTLGIVGLGNIGRIVADRAQGLKMKVIAFDPYTNPEAASRLGVALKSFDEVLAQSDYITVHTTLTEKTRGLINDDAFAKMKNGVYILNCARGGIVDEDALVRALDSGKVAGAALDVFAQEPAPAGSKLVAHDKVICTPHLGASTHEAQVNVAVDVAHQIINMLVNDEIKNAVNTPAVSTGDRETLRPFLDLAERLGAFVGQWVDGAKMVSIEYAGEITKFPPAALTQSVVKGMISQWNEGVNLVNALVKARERGIDLSEVKRPTREDYVNLVTVKLTTHDGREHTVSGTLFGRTEPRIVRIDTYKVDVAITGVMLFIENKDRPGVVGKVGTCLGENQVNIARMGLGLDREKGEAIILAQVDTSVPPKVLERLAALEHVHSVRQLVL